MNLACRYAIVQFMPYAETGEFANVGVLLYCRARGYFDYRLTTRRGRITQFFPEMERGVLPAALKAMAAELARVRALIDRGSLFKITDEVAPRIFEDLVRPREATLRFGKPRVVLAQDPAGKLNELFDEYVGRAFVTKEYQEKVIERDVRAALKQAQLLARYDEAKVGTDEFHVRFPFVLKADGTALKAIRPINLGQMDASDIFDHGGHWIQRLERLRRLNALPREMLFAAKGPEAHTGKRAKAYREIKAELSAAGAQVIAARDKAGIIRFAEMDGLGTS